MQIAPPSHAPLGQMRYTLAKLHTGVSFEAFSFNFRLGYLNHRNFPI